MTARPRIDIEITADSSDARKNIDNSGDALDKFKDKAGKAGAAAAGAVAGLVALGIGTLDSAAAMQRAQTTVSRTFGDATAAVESFAEDSAAAVGISKEAYLTSAAQIGVSLKGMGLSVDEAAAKQHELQVTAGDMALALGTDVPTATEALSAALRGEMDALGNFGVSVDDATVKAGLAAKGISGPEGMDTAAYEAAYQQELLNQVLVGAGSVYGGYRAETDTTTEKTDALKASFEDTKAELGEQLLPMFDTAMTKLSEFIGWIGQNKEAIYKWLPVIGAAAGAIWLLNFALAANPVVLLALAILALIAVLYIFREDIGKTAGAIDDFMSVVDNIVPGFAAAREIIKFMSGDFSTLVTWAGRAASAIQSVIDAWEWLTTTTVPGIPLPAVPQSAGRGGGTFAALSVAPDVGLRAAGVEASGAVPAYAAAAFGGGVTIINVTGALDPDAVARQIDGLLRGRSRRAGAVVL